MSRDFATDPEIAADLDRRARSERDASRTRGEADHGYGWLPEQPDEFWPCRGCGKPVGIPPSAIDAARQCNRKLVAMGQKPFRKHELAVCGPCRAKERLAERERELQRGQAIAALTRELRHGVHPWRVDAIADELRGLGADVEQILREVAQANESKQAPANGARRKSL